MTSEMELAGLPVTFTSTKVVKTNVKSSSERNRKKRAQKKLRKNKDARKKDHENDYEEEEEEVVDHFNYAEEFKINEVLTEYKSPFTILMSKDERYKPEQEEEYEEEGYDEVEEEKVVYQEDCDLDYGFDNPEPENVDTTDIIEAIPDTHSKSKPKKGTSLQKYYQQRYDYFKLFDHGIQIDEEGWYSVTPEIIADHIALEGHAIALTNKSETADVKDTVIVDAFCGVGGNTIQFAKYFDRVIAIDLDEGRLAMARNNAEVYGVADKITFIHGDVFKVLPELKEDPNMYIDLVFMSPPWGGPNYVDQPIFCPCRDLLDNRGEELFHLGRSISKNLILFLPRQTDIWAVAEMVKNENGGEDSFVVEQHWLRNRIKAISIYFYS